MTKAKKNYLKKELDEFKILLNNRRQEIVSDVDRMSTEVLHRNRDSSAANESNDFSDQGSESFEEELKIGLIESEQEELTQIDDSIERIKSGTYGACLGEECLALIPKNRLKALPFATLCIECQVKQEESF